LCNNPPFRPSLFYHWLPDTRISSINATGLVCFNSRNIYWITI